MVFKKKSKKLSPILFSLSASQKGFTLIEVLVASGLFIIISYFVYLVVGNIFEVILRNQWRSDAVAVIQNELETIRNMNYTDVGIQGGAPAGVLEAEKIVYVENTTFIVRTTVRNIDDDFDGTLGGTPNDTSPADYKLVEVEAECVVCPGSFGPVIMTTTVAPKSLETATNNGSLFINVLNAFGQPVASADVHVVNASTTPTIDITDQTNINGVLQLVDIPTSTESYEISVSKSGYSSEQTYPPGDPDNPNPVKPHATVASQQVTSISFRIDELGSITVKTQDEMCNAVPNIDFLQESAKKIGLNPDVLKYTASSTTGGSGSITINNLEWDTYTFSNLDTAYDIAGKTPRTGVVLDPASSTSLAWMMEPTDVKALLISVEDNNGASVPDATVRLEGTAVDETRLTGRRTVSYTDWSGANYDSQNGGINDNNPAGELNLAQVSGVYPTSTQHWLISNTIDFGTSNTTFYTISWNPTTQPAGTTMQMQIASNNDNSSWNFLGPDGTTGTYYTSSTETIHALHSGDRYMRYQVYMETTDEAATPTLEDITFDFSSACIPSGQVFFAGLPTMNSSTISITKTGFQPYTATSVIVTAGWQEFNATLTP